MIPLPQDRATCSRCTRLRQRGERLSPHCLGCLHLNLHLVPLDHPTLKKMEADLDAIETRLKLGMDRELGAGIWKTKVGFSGMTPAQRQVYDRVLAASLQKAKLAGKPTYGNHLNPYKLGALSVAVAKDRGGASLRAKAHFRKRRSFRQFLHKVRMAHMMAASGLRDRKEREEKVERPKAVFTTID